MPIPVAASVTFGGTFLSPVVTLRKMIWRLKAVRAMIAVVAPRPVSGRSRKKKEIDGIV
ncbi:MAG TPA: hypothetical protein PL137_10450 [Nocardioides sp.]|nr:hypothetical protein [Nocardioides sp.]